MSAKSAKTFRVVQPVRFVEVPQVIDEIQGCSRFMIEEGALLIYAFTKELLADPVFVYAPGCWEKVHEVGQK